MKSLLRRIANATYRLSIVALTPLNALLAETRKRATFNRSVLHVSYLVHVPYNLTRTLRRHGVRADYLAVSDSAVWDKCDYRAPRGVGPVKALREFVFFWRVMARYEVVHLHFALTMSSSGWELRWLKRLGRRIVVHFRGCEARNRERNMALHPAVNICQQCDYSPRICEIPEVLRRNARARQYGEVFLVTTPDMLDFVPTAKWLPFLAVEAEGQSSASSPPTRSGRGSFKVVHATNHPGIEGTDYIKAAIERVRARGIPIDFVFLQGVPPDRVLRETADADLTIGKMKMGYYANAQIESLTLGVPAITSVRPEFMTPELEDSGLIFSTLDTLADTLEFYLRNPNELARKRSRARESVRQLHNSDHLAARLLELYGMTPASSAEMPLSRPDYACAT